MKIQICKYLSSSTLQNISSYNIHKGYRLKNTMHGWNGNRWLFTLIWAQDTYREMAKDGMSCCNAIGADASYAYYRE